MKNHNRINNQTGLFHLKYNNETYNINHNNLIISTHLIHLIRKKNII